MERRAGDGFEASPAEVPMAEADRIVEAVDEYHVLRFSGWGHEDAVAAAYPRAVPKEEPEPVEEPDEFWDVPL